MTRSWLKHGRKTAALGEVAQQFIDQYFADIDALGVKRPMFIPGNRTHSDIIETVAGLWEKACL